MAYYRKVQKKINGKWYPQSITIGKAVTTKEVANRLADLSALSPGDCYSMLGNLGKVLGEFMNSGRTVKLDGVGTFYYTANTAGQGVDSEEEVSAKQPWQQQSGNDPFARQRKHVLGGTETGFVRIFFGRE